LAIRARQCAEIVIEGVIFFHDDHDMLDCHFNLPSQSGRASGSFPATDLLYTMTG